MRRPLATLGPLLGALIGAGCSTFGAQDELTSLFRRHDDHAVQVAALVVDLDTGATLFARESRRLLRPASTMKLLTTAAICRHDPNGAIETVLTATSGPDGGIAMIGDGDPFLTTADLRDLVAALAQRGVTRVGSGGITIVDPLRTAPRFGEGWMWDDEPYTFMPAISGAAVDGGCVTVAMRGTNEGVEARLLPVAGPLNLEVQAGKGSPRATRGRYRSPNRITVTGHLDAGAVRERRLTVPDPAHFTATVLAGELRAHGLLDSNDPTPLITLTNDAPAIANAAPRVHIRRPISEIVNQTNKVSDNLGAELLLRRLGTLEAGDTLDADAIDRGLERLNADLTKLGLDPTGYRIADGSGVSHYTLVTAEALVTLLVGMHQLGGRSYETFEASLPIAGRDGTLSGRMKDTAAEGRVHAKTGTISGVSNLAGYVTTRTGRNLAFAILTQNFVGSAAPWRQLQDEFCAQLAEM